MTGGAALGLIPRMLDPRAPVHLIGLAVLVLGASMVVPMTLDVLAGEANWRGFALSGFLTVTAGGLAALVTRGVRIGEADIRQIFVLTVALWTVLPAFGALPLILGAPALSPTDAFFESMSGMTTTGSTVIAGIDALPPGAQIWRGMLQWFGGLGIVVVALVFLPEMRVGGMQFFRSEAFDTQGKPLPRAAVMAASLTWVYVALTVACALVYDALGMSGFDASVHALTTVATGGFANYDGSMSGFGAPIQYAASFFMFAASIPFIRVVQLAAGTARPLLVDAQIRAYLVVLLSIAGAVSLQRIFAGGPVEESVRHALFNTISIVSGTGYASADYGSWGAFVAAIFFIGGLIGGCTGSTCCSVKIFRYQILLVALGAGLRKLHSPNAVVPLRYEGRKVEEEVISSVVAFFFLFMLTLAVVAISLGVMGYDIVTAVSGAATALANVGPGLGPVIGPSGNFAPLSDEAKWLLSGAMLLGRLELMAVFALFTAAFWRA